MNNIRIIPRLDIKGPNLVKGIHLEGLRVLGKPEAFARYYYECGADELIYIDTVASLYGRNNLLHIIEKTAKDIFIPLTVGGGLRSLDDVRAVLRAGADRVAINTAAIHDPKLIRKLSRAVGSSTIAVSIAVLRQPDGRYLAYIDNGREYTGLDVFKWACDAAELGAGEIVLTSIDREGTGQGFDIELTRKVSESVPIPVVACGGAGTLEHIKDVVLAGKADAVGLASMLHYNFVHDKLRLEDYANEGNIEYLKSGKKFRNFAPASIKDIKTYLITSGIDCRPSFIPEAADAR